MKTKIRKSIHSFIVTRYELIFEAEGHLSFQSYCDTHVINSSITPQGLSPNQKTQKRALENAERRYAQGRLSLFARVSPSLENLGACSPFFTRSFR